MTDTVNLGGPHAAAGDWGAGCSDCNTFYEGDTEQEVIAAADACRAEHAADRVRAESECSFAVLAALQGLPPAASPAGDDPVPAGRVAGETASHADGAG